MRRRGSKRRSGRRGSKRRSGRRGSKKSVEKPVQQQFVKTHNIPFFQQMQVEQKKIQQQKETISESKLRKDISKTVKDIRSTGGLSQTYSKPELKKKITNMLDAYNKANEMAKSYDQPESKPKSESTNCDPHYLCSSHTSATYLRKQMGFKSSTECKKNICTGPYQNIHAETESWLKTNHPKKKAEGHCPSNYRVFDKTTGRVSCSKKTTGSSRKSTSSYSPRKSTSSPNRVVSNQAKHFASLRSTKCTIPCPDRCSMVCHSGIGFNNPCCKGGRPDCDKC
jgi:hypothetical protein